LAARRCRGLELYIESPKYCFWIEWNEAASAKLLLMLSVVNALCMSLGIGLKKVKPVNMDELAPCLVLNQVAIYARFRGEKQPT